MAYSTTNTSTLGRIAALATERQALWAKAGRGERLTEAERGRLTDIHHRLDQLWDLRRQEKAMARAAAPKHTRGRARRTYRRQAERRGAAQPH
jgi:hypothetical protein